jgi:hypothetical protein
MNRQYTPMATQYRNFAPPYAANLMVHHPKGNNKRHIGANLQINSPFISMALNSNISTNQLRPVQTIEPSQSVITQLYKVKLMVRATDGLKGIYVPEII